MAWCPFAVRRILVGVTQLRRADLEEVLSFLVDVNELEFDDPYQRIAAQFRVAPSTLKKHLEHMYEKLGVGRRTAAATLVHAIH